MILRYFCILLLICLISSSVNTAKGKKSEDDDNDKNSAERVVLLNNDGENVGTSKGQSPATYDISEDDINKMEQKGEPAENSASAAGDEFTPEEKEPRATLSNSEMYAWDLYDEAMKYLDKGKAYSVEARKGAYRLLDKSAQLKWKDSMKLMGYSYLFGDYTRWSIDEARNLFEELAQGGSVDAHLALAFLHGTGIGVSESSQAISLLYYTFSALGGNPLSQMAMGYRYWAGISVKQNCERALIWYKKVASRVASQVRLSGGIALQRIRLPDELDSTIPTNAQPTNVVLDTNLLNYYKYLADKGDIRAQVDLGKLYLTGGRGIEQNVELASHYFTAAAETGSATAHAHLGKMYLDGTAATPQDYSTAFHFFKKAADRGNPIGQSGLGVMYLYGKGVQKDYSKAYRLFMLAAEQNWVDGQLHLGHIYYRGLGVKRNFNLAIKYFQLALQSGHILAYYNLAQIHATGTGVTRSCQTAVELYKNVAERGRWSERLMEAYLTYRAGRKDAAAFKYLFLAELGYEPAQTNFAYIIDRDETGMFDKDEALQRAFLHWQRSANQDYSVARIKLGDYYYYGYGTPIDYEMAAAQYKIASDRHQAAQAMFNLGYMHEQGLGLNKDLHLAKRFYDMAAEISEDAYIPVNIALFKLSLIFYYENLKENPLMASFDLFLGSNWDLYLMAFMVLLISALWFNHRRQRIAEQ